MNAAIPAAALLTSTLLLAACIPGKTEAPAQSNKQSSFVSQNARQCIADLKSANVNFRLLANRDYGGGCRAHDAVQLLDFGTPTTNLGPMTCQLASGFTGWTRDIVRPAARKYFGSRLAKIETSGTYSCRRISGSGNLSQHAFANAIDIFGFVLEDGRRITLLGGWNGKKSEQRFLRHIQEEACGRFGTVLGPRYDRQHADHFHFDMKPSRMNGNAFCR